MNYYVKLFIVDVGNSTGLLLYGYSLPTSNLEVTEWNRGSIGHKKLFYRYTKTMNKEQFEEFKTSLSLGMVISLDGKLSLSDKFMKRPTIISYPKNRWGKNIDSPIKDLSYVDEYWSINKSALMHKLLKKFESMCGREQRNMVISILDKLSEETGLCFYEEGARKLGNIELYTPQTNKLYFKSYIDKNENKKLGYVAIIEKIKPIEFDVNVHCALYNGGVCIFDCLKEMNKSENKISFNGNEPISEIKVEIWNKDTGELIYFSESSIMRKMHLSIHMKNNETLRVNDKWTEDLMKCFGNGEEGKGKVLHVVEVKHDTIPITSKIGDSKDDPWVESQLQAMQMIRPYKVTDNKGVFCKKTSSKDGEITSFLKIKEYLEESGIRQAIIMDPFFSIESMSRYLPRINNSGLKLEIITSLISTNPDKDPGTAESIDEKYHEKVKLFLKNNEALLHNPLKILNITHGKQQAFHDRYLLRYHENGLVDGFLLSNSLNSAGSFYPFVTAPMDQGVVYDVLEYIKELIDFEIQKKMPKSLRVDSEVIWDTFQNKDVKEPKKYDLSPWQMEISGLLECNEPDILERVFNDSWDSTSENSQESIKKCGWLLYNSVDYQVQDILDLCKKKNIKLQYIASIIKEIARQLEDEEEIAEKDDIHRLYSEAYKFRLALDKMKQEEIKINSKYLLDNFLQVFYKRNGYLYSVYQLVCKINPVTLVDIMEEYKSPMALEILLSHLTFFEKLDVEVYERLLKSDIVWLRDLAYSYAGKVYLDYIKNYKDFITDWEIEKLLDSNLISKAYQYAYLLGELSFNRRILKERKKCDMDLIEVFNSAYNDILNKLSQVVDKENGFERETFYRLLREEPSDEKYSDMLLGISMTLTTNIEAKNKLLIAIIDLMKNKWSSMHLHFSREVDYVVTGNAAYAAFELFGDNFDSVIQYVNISKRYISIALEPGKKDINYSVWNNAVLMVLWQILFIIDYKMIVDDKLNDKITLNGYEELLFELEKIKNQLSEWHDDCGLSEALFRE